jgi:hypothetical protein
MMPPRGRCGVIRGVSDPPPRRREISEPRLAMLALVAVLVGVLCVVALADTDDIWIIAVTVVAIVLIAILIVVDIYRVIG